MDDRTVAQKRMIMPTLDLNNKFYHMKAIDIIINSILGEVRFNRPVSSCPNCWGTQQYNGVYRQKFNQEVIDLNNIKEKRGWIRALAIENLEGLRFKRTFNLIE